MADSSGMMKCFYFAGFNILVIMPIIYVIISTIVLGVNWNSFSNEYFSIIRDWLLIDNIACIIILTVIIGILIYNNYVRTPNNYPHVTCRILLLFTFPTSLIKIIWTFFGTVILGELLQNKTLYSNPVVVFCLINIIIDWIISILASFITFRLLFKRRGGYEPI